MQYKMIGASLAAVLLSSAAMAADLPSRRAPPVYVPPPIPVFSWTGFYVGGQVGYEFGKSNAYATSAFTGAGLAGASAQPSGVIGGAHVGYNFSSQSIPGLSGFGGGAAGVIGIEGDVDGSNYRANYLLGGVNNTVEQNIQGSIRGRAGIAVDRVLFYATGGAAFGSLQNNYISAISGLNDQLSHTKVGWTVGGGVEYAISNNWSLRAEYRYTDFGNVTDSVGIANVSHHETDNRVQAGFSYKFDTFAPIAPVVARY